MHELSFHRAGALLIPSACQDSGPCTHTPLKHKDRQNLTPKGCLSSCPHLSSFKTQYHVPNQPHHSPGHQHKMASQSQASVQFVVFRDHLTAYNSVSRDGFVSSHTVRYHRFPHERISEGIHRDGGLCTVSRELHKDGGTHYHAFVDYQRVRD